MIYDQSMKIDQSTRNVPNILSHFSGPEKISNFQKLLEGKLILKLHIKRQKILVRCI